MIIIIISEYCLNHNIYYIVGFVLPKSNLKKAASTSTQNKKGRASRFPWQLSGPIMNLLDFIFTKCITLPANYQDKVVLVNIFQTKGMVTGATLIKYGTTFLALIALLVEKHQPNFEGTYIRFAGMLSRDITLLNQPFFFRDVRFNRI